MSAQTDPASSGDPATNSYNEPLPVPPPTNPHFALFVATAGGLGYFPRAPGTLGSLVGLLMALLPSWIFFGLAAASAAAARSAGIFLTASTAYFDPLLGAQLVLMLLIAALGVWASDRVSKRFREKDPQYVVIDEVSGQHLALLLGCGIPVWWRVAESYRHTTPLGLIALRATLNWKYLLLGFILFRVFDIWKPFPARQAESLPGGWGIMADDWIAGIYAAIGLWLARAAGL
jgi:phosphatidylglycerophosphatase A